MDTKGLPGHWNDTKDDNSSQRGETLPIIPGQVALWLELSSFIVIDIFGLTGNVFVIAIIIFGKNMKTSANYFISSLAVADLLVCLWVLPNVIMTRWYRRWTLGNAMCVVQAFVNHTSLFASIFNLAGIAVNRLVATRFSNKYPSLFSPKLNCIYIGVTWLFALLYSAFPIMGWGMYAFDNKRINCIFSRKAAPSFSFFFAIGCVIVPFTISALCYILIWMTYVKSRRTVNLIEGTLVMGGAALSEKKLTKNLFIVLLTFFFCWLPMNSMFFVDPQGKLNTWVYTFALWVMLCNSCINPVIYGTRKKFRTEYIRLVSKIRLPKLKTSKTQSTSSRPVAPTNVP